MLVHFWQYQLRQEKSGAKMHRYHLIEIGQRIFFNGNNRPVVTCVVHQNSYRTKFFTRRVDDPPAFEISAAVEAS